MKRRETRTETPSARGPSRSLWALALATSLCTASTASAAEGRARAWMERALTTTGPEYVAARTALLELGAEARRALEARHAGSTHSASSWREDVTVEALLVWMTAPETARRAYALEGVTPGRYLRFRRPDPEVGRELAQLDLPAALLFEMELRVQSAYPFAPRSAYPERSADSASADARWKELRTKESFALRAGVLGAIARSSHPARGHLLAARLADRDEDVRIRRIAALGLPSLGEPAAVTLGAVATDPAAPVDLRTGALSGLGRIRTRAALASIEKVMAQDDRLELQRASIAALGALGSTWAAEHTPAAEAAQLREDATRALIARLVAPRGAALEDNLVEALSMVATPALKARLAALARDDARDEEVRRRAAHAEARVARALSRAS